MCDILCCEEVVVETVEVEISELVAEIEDEQVVIVGETNKDEVVERVLSSGSQAQTEGKKVQTKNFIRGETSYDVKLHRTSHKMPWEKEQRCCVEKERNGDSHLF